jgi:7-cyano-7-deazaguanosine (preQ0) biosynthesis protein QueE
MLKVNEIFGPTFQGEGPYAGQPCAFVRLSGCNLECSWCDTPYTWAFTPQKAEKHQSKKLYDKTQEERLMDEQAVLDEVLKLTNGMVSTVVVSGGEPLMQQSGLERLARLLLEHGIDMHIETAGTIAPTSGLVELVDHFTVSPKLANSGNLAGKRFKPAVLATFAMLPQVCFKYVVEHAADLHEVDAHVVAIGAHRGQVMIMPEGTDENSILGRATAIADEVLKRGYGMTLRQHVLLWGDKRGV